MNYSFYPQLSSVLVILLYFLPCQSEAQNTGSIAGYVRDQKTEIPLLGATVKILDTDKGATTDANGYFSIQNIIAETYTISVSFIGYKTHLQYNVVVKTGGIPDIIVLLEEDVSNLEDIEVTASPFQKTEETPLSIQRLTREEIATFPGGNNDIAKVVQALPGVSGSVGGFRNDVIIRGGAPNENVYYLDGIEIPNINHFATQGSAGGPVGLLNVSFFEGVTLSTSAFPAEYDNVLSGVLQFNQRKGNNRKIKTNIRVSSSEAALTLEGPILKKNKEFSNTSIIASVRRSYLQLLFKLIKLPFIPDYWDYQYKLHHKIDEYNEIAVTGVGSIDDFSVNILDNLNEEQQAILDQVPIIKQQTNTMGISWKRRLQNGKGFMVTSLSNNILNNNFSQYKDNQNPTEILLKNSAREMETKLRFAYTHFQKKWTITSGVVLQNADYQINTQNFVNNFQFQNQINFWRYGLFGQAFRKFLNEKLTLSLGVRVDGNSFTDSGHEIYKTLSPRLSLSYALDPLGKWTVNTSLGRYYKIPPYTVLGFQNNAGDKVNKKAQYIESDHFVVGTEYLLNAATRVSIEGFYKKYNQYPISLTDSVSLANLGADFSVLGNEPVQSSGAGRTYGLELLIQKKLTRHLYGILSLTFFKSEFTGFDKNTFLPSSWDSNVLITFTGGYKFKRNWELSARVRYLGKTPYAPIDEEKTRNSYPSIVKDYTRQGANYLGAFNQTDIRIDKKWNLKKLTINVFLEFQNVFSQQSPQEPQYGLLRDNDGNIVSPRQLKIIENVESGSFIPNIGLVVDF